MGRNTEIRENVINHAPRNVTGDGSLSHLNK